MDHRRLFGIIPMAGIRGLQGTSPDGRFTNGYVWSDQISAMIANEFEKKNLIAQKGYDDTDIADAVINGDLNIASIVRKSYSLKSYKTFDFQGKNLVRSYDEGGLTAHDYSWSPSKSMSRFFKRIIVSKLAEKRSDMLRDDESLAISQKHKAETLVIEWSGGNDLITVNEAPSFAEVDLAIQARVENIKQLIKQGYRHFELFNLPDLSLTPRYQAKSVAEQENAHECSMYFNRQLEIACQQLALQYRYCSIHAFDVCSVFTRIYKDPEQYHFERAKLKVSYKSQKDDFVIRPDGTSPAEGYMFWDDIHPSADMHAQLAEFTLNDLTSKYNFTEPNIEAVQEEVINLSEEQLLASFRSAYAETLNKDRSNFLGSFRRTGIANFAKANLEEVLQHALYEGGKRSLAVMQELQWFDQKGNPYLNIPVLEKAIANVRRQQAATVNAH